MVSSVISAGLSRKSVALGALEGDETKNLGLNVSTILGAVYEQLELPLKVGNNSQNTSATIQTFEINADARPASVTPNDPMFGSQWHLNGANGINVQSVWDDYRGEGITIGFIDDGTQFTHPDLDGNYNTAIDYDSYTGAPDGSPKATADKHGTTTAGVAGAEGNNSLGVTGVAYEADITSFRMNFAANITDSMLAQMFTRAGQVDVTNNSWGFTGFFSDNFNTVFPQTRNEIANGAANGRDGLGSNLVFAAGNGRETGDNTNYHNFQNSKFVITVAATDSAGKYTYFSTPGASLLVSAPGLNITSTDRTGSAGYVSGDYVSGLAGTSYAAPIVSGVVALMLDANPNLGWRDVQEILAYSARNSDAAHAGWKINGAPNWNGGGLHFSHDYGYGLVNAHDAVRLAETWQTQSTSANMVAIDSGVLNVSAAIPDNNAAGITRNFNFSGTGLVIDKVEIDLNLTHTWIGDLRVQITSPYGTQSMLVNRPGVNPDTNSGWGSSADNINFTLTSNAYWGEMADGNWSIKIMDVDSGYTGNFGNWRIRAYGDGDIPNDVYFYTDEFSNVANAGRMTLSDTGGLDTINAAAVTSDTTLSMVAGTNSSVDGVTLTLMSGTIIENAFTGDGNDTVLGNSVANVIDTGRGNDLIEGAGGNDSIRGGIGFDTARFFGVFLDYIINILDALTLTVQDNNLANGDDGFDTLISIEKLLFDGISYLFNGSAVAPEFPPVVNTLPVALNDSASTDEDQGVTINVLANDSDGDGHSLSVTGISTAPTHGTAAVNANNTITYTPEAGWFGSDSFNYSISDDNGGSATAQVDVTVNEVVPPPPPPPNTVPVAQNDSANTMQGQAVVVNVLANDSDANSDLLQVTGATAAAHGTVVVNANNTITYTPEAAWFGSDSFEYTIDDGHGGSASAQVDVTITQTPPPPPNTAPVAQNDSANTTQAQAVTINVLANDSDANSDVLQVTGAIAPAHGTVVVNANNTITYTPDSEWVGGDIFNYSISDGHGGTASAQVSVNTAQAAGQTINGTGAANTLNGGAGNDTISGNGGNDTINGNGGNDAINGDAGNDTINGGSGNDVIHGNAGNDTMVGGDGNDIMYSDSGSDKFTGGSGADTMIGNSGGRDTFIYQNMGDAGDTIQNFRRNQDVLDLRELFNSLGYTGTNPVANGYLKFQTAPGSDLQVLVDSDGTAGPNGFTLLTTLDNVTFTTLTAGTDYLVQ